MNHPVPRLGRRSFVLGAAGAATLPPVTLPRFAHAAEFNYKYGSELPLAHPQVIRAKEACEAVRKDTGGRVDIEMFPAGALGSITDMISQVRSGALQMLNVATASLTTFGGQGRATPGEEARAGEQPNTDATQN